MSWSPIPILFDRDHAPGTYQLRDIPNSRQQHSSMFSSLKKKLSRRGSNPLSERNTKTSASNCSTPRGGYLAPESHNPFTSSSPATRRPDRLGMNAFSTQSNEPPPAYTPGPGNPGFTGASTMIAPNTASSVDDPYAFLKSFDTIFLIDDSGSMAGRSWRETGKALETITPICTARDADGIDIYFLNHPDSSLYKNVTSPSTVVEIFQTVRPGNATPTGQRLDQILRPYLAKYEDHRATTKPINIIVITDGEPTDDVESPIIYAAKELDRLKAPAWQVGIQFFQVGNERSARDHLKQLDNDLRIISKDPELRDMVDTVPFTGDNGAELTATGIMKVVLGSVNRRLDRNSIELHRR